MQPDDVLSGRRLQLEQIVLGGFDDAPAQVQGFVARAMHDMDVVLKSTKPLLTIDACNSAARFDGYPALARFGYVLGVAGPTAVSSDTADNFLHFIEQQRSRPGSALSQLGGDTLVLLGLADGLHAIEQRPQADGQRINTAKAWVKDLLGRFGSADPRFAKARLFAADLLEPQGRFGQQLVISDDVESSALELCLYRAWSGQLRSVRQPDVELRRALFKKLLANVSPGAGELAFAASWLCALDVLLDELARESILDVNRVVQILKETQGSLRRWRWESAPTRKGAIAARWLIDKEADVQSFLLAVLYPYFGKQLEDEQFLRGFGLRQGRFDFAITNLGLIVEVKVLRVSSDLQRLESEIAEDLALYFKDGNPFTSMIVYIYDDRDRPEPEKYPLIRDAFSRRDERIVDVVIIQRPSMIPNQNARGGDGEASDRPTSRSVGNRRKPRSRTGARGR